MRYKFDKNNRIYPFRRLFSQCRNNSFKNSNDYSRKNRREQALLARILIANHASHFHYIPSNDIYIYIYMDGKIRGSKSLEQRDPIKRTRDTPAVTQKKKNHGKMGTFEKKSEEFLGKRSILFPFFSASFALLFAIIGPTNDLRVVSWSSLHRGADIATVSKERQSQTNGVARWVVEDISSLVGDVMGSVPALWLR